jgi:general secretion pathway protein A
MYNDYFGFREKPFKLVPNPQYLFLSKSHEEALAHLNYAIGQGDGFVEITGEVGTGKTTLCRAFLENLDDTTVAAYIFNPKLGPKQLIKSITDEFGIQYNAEDTKDLIDKLNRFLIQKKTERKKVIVLIDEAQNLKKAVLEQLRLLSNLETRKEKLLQIILVGQPELAEMLDSHDLRQIGQRISLRYQITPLSLKETQEYIQYRLNIASQKRARLFDPAAIRRIYVYSRGIPRVINIACDRALLTAFSMNRPKVTGRIAKAALSEMTHRGQVRRSFLMDGRTALALFILICGLAAALLYHEALSQAVSSWLNLGPAATGPAVQPTETAGSPQTEPPSPPTAAANPPTPTPSAEAKTPAPAAEPAATPRGALRLADQLRRTDLRASRQEALREVLAAWGTALEPKRYLEAVDDDPTFFNLSAKSAGFFVQRIEGDLEILRRLNMPAVLELRSGGKQASGYLALTGVIGGKLLLKAGVGYPVIETDAGEISQNWGGVAYIPWKNFLSLSGTIPGSAPADSVLALKMLLRDLGYTGIPLTKDYDSITQKTVEQIQAKYGLPKDGVVGNLTKIILYREGKNFDIPRLTPN